MTDKKKIKFIAKCFLDIPYRVTIHKLLRFIEFDNDFLESCGKFGCFGYFKKDRFRTIWMIFSAIILEKKFPQNVFIDTRSLHSLYLWNPHTSLGQEIYNQSMNMHCLRALRISTPDVLRYGFSTLCYLFSKPSCFENLRILELKLGNAENKSLINREWIFHESTKNLFSRLRCFMLEIKAGEIVLDNRERFVESKKEWYYPSKNFQEMLLNNLRDLQKIKLVNIIMKDQLCLKLENIEEIYLSGCTNISVSTNNQNFRKLSVRNTEGLEFLKTYKNVSNYIRTLEVVFSNYFDGDSQVDYFPLFLSEDFPLTNLKSLKLEKLSCENYFQQGYFEQFVESMCIVNCFGGIQSVGLENFFKAIYPRLSNLTISQSLFYQNFTVKLVTMKKIPLFETLSTLKLFNFTKEMNRLFENNEMKILENLFISGKSIFESPSVVEPLSRETGKVLNLYENRDNIHGTIGIASWKSIPMLRKFSVQFLPITDSFLASLKLPSIREISIRGCDYLTGYGYKDDVPGIFEDVKILEICDCRSIKDTFFIKKNETDFRFDSLRELYIRNVRFLTGEPWKGFPKLSKLTLIDVPLLENCMFTKVDFPNLQELVVTKKSSVKKQLDYNYWDFEKLEVRTSDLDSFHSPEENRKDLDIVVENYDNFKAGGKDKYSRNASSFGGW